MIIYNGLVLETHYPTWVKSFRELANAVKETIELHYEYDVDPYFFLEEGRTEIGLMAQENNDNAAYMHLDTDGHRGLIEIAPGYDSAEIDTNLFIHVVQGTIQRGHRVLMLFRNEDYEYVGYGLTQTECFKVESVMAIKKEDRYGTYYIDAQNWADKKELRAAAPVKGPPKRKLFIPKGGQ